MFRILAGCVLLLALFWNSIVLRPRSWNATVISRAVVIEVALVLLGLGLIRLKKWAAIGLSAAIAIFMAEEGPGLFGICMMICSLILTVAFWPLLVGAKRRDIRYLIVALMIGGLTEYVAFILRRG